MPDRAGELSRGPFVVAVGPLPPPMHGQAAITRAFVDHIGGKLRLHVCDISPGTIGGVWSHLTKASRVLRAAMRIVVVSPTEPSRVLYLSADARLGILYNIAIAGIGRLCGYRVFLHHHSFAYIDRHSALMSALVRVIGRSGTHIVLCDAMAAGLRARYALLAAASMIELSGAAFLELYPASYRDRADELRIGFLSNLIIEKGFDTAIDLLRAARAEKLPVRFLVAGPAPDRRAQQIVEAAQKEFGAAFDYRGPLYGEEKARFFRSLDTFVFPTRYFNEARPQVVLESLCHGVPVLTIARGCIAGDVDASCGICVARDADFVTAALPSIRNWCADRELLARSRAAAFRRAQALHRQGTEQLAAIVAALG